MSAQLGYSYPQGLEIGDKTCENISKTHDVVKSTMSD